MPASTTPRILHVCKVFLPVRGGVQRVVSSLTALLPNYKHRVITTGEDGAIVEQRMGAATVWRGRSYAQLASLPVAPSLVFRLIREFRQHQIIAVHYPFPLADLALLFCFGKTPIVVHWHSNIVAQKRLRWLVAPFTWAMLLRARAIVVSSDAMIENSYFLKKFRSKIQVIPYGIEAKCLPATKQSANGYFALVGRHVSYKGIDVAIRAIKKTDANLVIVGDGPLFERHRQMVKRLDLTGQITFDRYASDDRVSEIIQNAIGLVVSSNLENEAFAIVQLEAMRFGKPVINTNLKSSVPWVARAGQEAITVAPNDSIALAQAMQTLVDKPDLAEKLGKAALDRFQTRFSAQRFSQETDALYRSLLNTSSE